MGLIIILSIVCTVGILVGVEFIRHLLDEKKRHADDSEIEGKLRYYTIKMVSAVIWTVIWVMVTAVGVFEFITNSKAYF